jgi:hypothetical protein
MQRCTTRSSPGSQPQSYGYTLGYKYDHQARVAAMRARDAFIILSAMASFAISLNNNYAVDGSLRSQWEHILDGHLVHAEWIANLKKSFVCDFTPGARVGAFVNAQQFRWGDHLQQFVGANVPLWFIWGTTKPEKKLDRTNPFDFTFPTDAEVRLARKARVNVSYIYTFPNRLMIQGNGVTSNQAKIRPSIISLL